MYLSITNQDRLPSHDLSEGDSNQSFFRRQWDSDQINATTRHWLAGDEQYLSGSVRILKIPDCRGLPVVAGDTEPVFMFHI